MSKHISLFLSASLLFMSHNLFASSVNEDDDRALDLSGRTAVRSFDFSGHRLTVAPDMSSLVVREINLSDLGGARRNSMPAPAAQSQSAPFPQAPPAA